MAKIDVVKENGKNPYLEEMADNLTMFIENINCLRETYEYSEQTLWMQKKEADRQFDELIKNFPLNTETGEMAIPNRHWREFQKKERRKFRAERALTLVPPSYLISMVSLYDQFYAGLVRLIYRIEPEKLKESQKPFYYRDLCDFTSVQEVKVQIIEETIDKKMRESHVEQIEWLAGAMDLKTLKKFHEWPAFVELTERRNLFVHSDGVVSQQYIDVCKSENALLKGVSKGQQLTVDREYFEYAYKILYIVGIKLTQMLAHTVYDKQYPNDYASIDSILISNVYELIAEGLYDVAISVSAFVHDDDYLSSKHTAHDKCYILLNYAQAYKWNGQPEKCMKLLEEADCTTWRDELLIPKFTLEEKYDLVYEKMRAMGDTSNVLTPENYRQWPIFKELRKEAEFAVVFKEVFGEDLELNKPMKVENKEKAETVTETTSVEEPIGTFFKIVGDIDLGNVGKKSFLR